MKNVNYQEELIGDIKKVTKTCKFIHNICVEKFFQVPVSQTKWNSILQEPVIDWKIFYIIPFKCSLSTKLRYFQFKILHNVLGVNKYLKTVGISNSDLCTFCAIDTESISHLFWECPSTQRFLLDFQRHTLNNKFILTHNNFIFGIPTGIHSSYNFVILYAKYYIFSARCKRSTLSLASFKKIIEILLWNWTHYLL